MSEEKSKEDRIWKLILITAAIVVPLLLGWLIYELVNLNDNVDKVEAQKDPQVQ